MATSRVSFAVDRLSQHVSVDCSTLSEGDWTALRLVAYASAGSQLTVRARVLVFTVTGFREALLPLSWTLRRNGIEKSYSDDALALIRLHSTEVASRREASLEREALPAKEIVASLATSGFLRKLTAEQLRDTGRLLALSHGADFSVPGAGKTTVLLAVHMLLARTNPDMRLLVVAPKNAFLSWEEEIAACLGEEHSMRRLLGDQNCVRTLLASGPRFSVINYELLRNRSSVLAAFMSRYSVHLVLDEAHRIKGGDRGVTAAAALALSGLAARRDILTGTPMPQALEDLGPQFDFLWPGQRVLAPVLAMDQDDPGRLQAATDTVRPLYVRTTKSELGLREPIIRQVPVELGPNQREIYELIRSEAARVARGMDVHSHEFFRGLRRHFVRLLQAGSNPALIVGESGGADDLDRWLGSVAPDEFRMLLSDFFASEEPAKLAATETLTRKLVEKLDRKVLVWSCWVGNINYLEDRLKDLGAVSIWGNVATGDDSDLATREGRIRLFRSDPDCRVMIANPAACGEGISLHTVCHDAIYADRSFNACHYMQSIDRIHRLGLSPEQETNIYVLSARDTIDSSVEARLAQKIARMSHVLDDRGLAALAYDPDDIVGNTPDGLDQGDVEEILSHVYRRQA